MIRFIAISGVLVLVISITGCGNSPSKSKAFSYCKDEVKKRLKSPSTSSFAPMAESLVESFKPITLSSGKIKTKYLVNGYVDSQNSFGAMLRKTYTCTTTGNNRGKWIIDNISIY
jgi:hypothetical protein